jgi:acyl-CoA-binding protein
MPASPSPPPSQALFLASSLALPTLPSAASLPQATKLRLYGLYKLLTVSSLQPLAGSRPGFWDPTGRAKWDAWEKVGREFGDREEEGKGEARREYVGVVRDCGWDGKLPGSYLRGSYKVADR